MNRKHLGDALDFWKGRLIGRLVNADLLRKPTAIPMPTDWPWKTAETEVYLEFLGLSGIGQLAGLEPFTHRGRDAYFDRVADVRGDLFLDPDTGVALGEPNEKHITVNELARLVRVDRSRVLLVYQHRLRKKDYLRRHVDRLSSGEFVCSAYDGGVVSMLFVSGIAERPLAITKHLSEYLGPVRQRIVEP